MGGTVDGVGGADFEAAVAEVLRLPADRPERAWHAAALIGALVGERGLPIQGFQHLDALLAAADRHPPQTAQWPRLRRMARVMSLMYGLLPGTPLDIDATAAELDAYAAEAVDDPTLTALMDCARAALLLRQATEQGDQSALHRMPDVVAGLVSPLPDDPTVAQLTDVLRINTEMLRTNQDGELASVWQQFDLMQEAIRKLPPDEREIMARSVEPVRVFRRVVDEDGPSRSGSTTEDDTAALDLLADTHPLEHGLIAGAGLLGTGRETDIARIDQGITQFRRALASAPPGHPRRGFCLLSVALALWRRSEVTGRTDGLDEAETLLEEAAAVLGGPQHPQWTFVHDLLTAVRQRAGDVAGLSHAVVAAQRGYAWRVLLEADPAGAQISIRDAAKDALEHARQSVTVGDPAGALRALDAGRGLLLFAATEAHRIPARLDAGGRSDLASQWSQQRPPSGGLRRQVLDVLTKQSADSLFDPPTLAQVQAALALLDADALVYLVPAEAPHGGLAVMAPAVGPPAYMPLPYLDLAEGTEVDRYLSALATRNAFDQGRDLSPEDTSGFADRVDALCDWAWRAAIGPLLESYMPRLAARPEGRVPRIVLIPMGDLARVPWHAARRKDGVYAVQLAGISQAVSARLLCENAALAQAPLGSTGLVVGDPDTGGRAAPLRSARLEAHAVRRAFYRGARYIGRLPDGRPCPSGAGTADEVRAWLTSRSPAAGSMLHLACHGFHASGADAGARLLLAANGAAAHGDRRADELAVEELVDLLAGVPDRAIALVVLAACNSGRSVYGYDEAYSLGTGFLAGGARSVLSTQWSVPDAATSSLMYLFHHNMRQRGLPVWQALRQAQMWMLDPHREPPHGMPPQLVPGPDDDPADVLGWAGFIHYGQ